MIRFAASLVLGLSLAASAALAQVPPKMAFQGRLTDNSGAVIPDSPVSVKFEIFDLAANGTSLYAETRTLTPQNGIVSTMIGEVTPLPATVFNGASRFLEITVGAQPLPLGPRIEIGTSGYAFLAATVPDGSIGNAKLAAGAVGDSLKIAASAVSTTRIRDGAVTSAKILDNTVASVDILNGTIGAADIGNGAIDDSLKIGDGDVSTTKIRNVSVTTAKIVDGAVTATKISDEPGLAGTSSTANIVLFSAPQPVLSRSITPPSVGSVVAIASANVELNAPSIGEAETRVFCSLNAASGTAHDN